MSSVLSGLWDVWLLLTNHLWQSALVLVALVLAERGLRRAPASLRADLWTLALLKLLVPATLGAWVWARVTQGAVAAVEMPAVTTVVSPVAASASSSVGWLAPVLLALTAAWAAGVAWHLVHLVVDLVRQSRFRRGAHPAVGPRWRAVATAAGIPAGDLLLAPAVRLPLVQGFLNPRILMPPHLVETLSTRELEALLRHEDCHRRRRDPLRFLLGRVAGALLWFFPPVWWLLAQLRQCAEFAGDDAALAGGAHHDEYTRALARAIRRGLDPAPPVAAAAGGGPSLMRRRLARLARKEENLMTHGRFILTVVLLVVAAAAFVPLNLVAAGTPPPPPPAVEEPVAEPAPPAAVEPVAPEQDPPPPPKKSDKPSLKAKAPKPPTKAKAEVEIQHPTIVELVEPVYPEVAKKKGIEGAVVVQVLVGPGGKVLKAKATKGPEALHKAALKAAKASTFKEGTRDGQPVKAWMAIPFKFKLD